MTSNGERVRLAARLRAARAYAGLDQAHVATKLKVNRSTYSLWESGATPASALQRDGLIRAMAEICELPIEFFTADFSLLAQPDVIPLERGRSRRPGDDLDTSEQEAAAR